MIKQIVFGFLILVTTGAFAQDLTATQTVPSSVSAGSSYTTEVTINRGSINGFMKFFLIPLTQTPSLIYPPMVDS